MATETAPTVKEEELDSSAAMGFFEHLGELRRRIFYCLVAVAAGLAVGLGFWERIYHFLEAPIKNAFVSVGLDDRLIFTDPLVPIKFALKVGLFAGIFLAIPVIFWQVWMFVAPGLYRRERRFILPFVFSSTALFLLGAYFAHGIVLPITLKFLLSFGSDFFEAFISINEYFSLWLTMVLWMGVIFELPVLIFILSWIGLLTPRFLLHYLRHAIVGIAFVAAVITPTTDVFTLAVFALPMIGLYVLGIGVSALVQLRRKRPRESTN